MLAVDASTVRESGPTGSPWRLHYAFDLTHLRCAWSMLTDVRTGETFRHVPLQAGDVAMGDRAYGTPPGVAHAQREGAAVLLRINLSNLPLYTPEGLRMRVLTRLRRLRVGQTGSWAVTVHAGDQSIAGRLVALKKSARAARTARRKLQERVRKTGEVLGRATVEAASYVILFTTLPQAEFSARRIVEWYRLRWQIELAFKRMKSILHLGQLPKQVAASGRAWLYGKLLVALLIERLIAEADAFSPWGYPLAPPAQPLAGNALPAP